MNCPRCGVDNVASRSTCYLCHAPLQLRQGGVSQRNEASSQSVMSSGGGMQTVPNARVPYGMGTSGAAPMPTQANPGVAPPQVQPGHNYGVQRNEREVGYPSSSEQLRASAPAPSYQAPAPRAQTAPLAQVGSMETASATAALPVGVPAAAESFTAEKTVASHPGLMASQHPDDEATFDEGPGASKLPSLPRPRLAADFVFAPKVRIPSLFRRVASGLIDFLLVCGVALLVAALFGPKMTHPFPEGLHGIDLLATILQRYTPQVQFFLLVFAVTYFVYTALLHMLRGQTVGKMLMRLRLIERNGKPCGFFSVFARSLALVLFLFMGLVGLSWILFDKEFRALHDRVSGCLVIQEAPTT